MILSARWVIPITSPIVKRGAVVVDGDRILDFGELDRIRDHYPEHPVREFGEAAILPGFVNVHSHLELSILRGYLEDLPFWQWIQQLTCAKYQVLNREEMRVSALLGAAEAILSGITTIGDPMDLGTSLDAVLGTGLRAVLYQEVFSPVPEEAESVLMACRKRMDFLQSFISNWGEKDQEEAHWGITAPPSPETAAWRRQRVVFGLSPHAPYTVSAPLFKGIYSFAQSQGFPLCIHIAESEAERLLLETGSGPIIEAWRKRGISWEAPRCSPVEYLHRLGVIGPSTLLVHCIWLKEGDFDILRATGPAIAHCPKSNWKLRHGAADLRKIRQNGLRIGLGTDSVASNNNMDFFEEMRGAFFNPSWSFNPKSGEQAEPDSVTASDILRMATLGGAEALGLASKIGSIEKAKQADLIVVDLSQLHVQPVFSPLTALVFSSRASDVRMTMVGGEILMEGCQLSSLDLSVLHQRIETIGNKLRHVTQ